MSTRTHCNCCFPDPPGVSIDVGVRCAHAHYFSTLTDSTFPWIYTQVVGFMSRDDGDGSTVYVVPYPEKEQPYQSFHEKTSGSYSLTRESSYAFSDPDTGDLVVKYFDSEVVTASGGAELTTHRDQPFTSCDRIESYDGFADFSKTTTGRAVKQNSDGSKTTYSKSVRSETKTYKGLGVFTVVDSRKEWDADGSITTDVTHVSETTSIDCYYGGGASVETETYSNTPSSHTVSTTSNHDSATLIISKSVTRSSEYLNPWSLEALRLKGIDCQQTKGWGPGSRALWDYDESVLENGEKTGWLGELRTCEMRYRFLIPEDFTGNNVKFEITERFTPKDYDPEDSYSPQPVETTKVVIWDGVDSEGGDTRETDWEYVPTPTMAGRVEVVGSRFQFYHGSRWIKPM